MFINLNWNEAKQRAFWSSVMTSFHGLDMKKISKFLFLLRPETEHVAEQALKSTNPLWLQLQDLPTTKSR
jgi:hypothetical protein